MSKPKLSEIFLFGNITLVYKNYEISNFNLDNIKKCIGKLKELTNTLDPKWYWRVYFNLKKIYIKGFQTGDKNLKFLKLIHYLLDYCFKNNIIDLNPIDIEYININKSIKKRDECKIALMLILFEINQQLIMLPGTPGYDYLKNKLSAFTEYLKNYYLKVDFDKPDEFDIWSPYWSLNINNVLVELDGFDIDTDLIFTAQNIKFNSSMIDFIKLLDKRITYLRNTHKDYYNNYIQSKIYKTTEILFNNLPYSIIFKDYLGLIKNHTEVYKPIILEDFDINTINDELWMFCILPRYLTSFMLGFPVITCDIPSDKNIKEKMKLILEEGMDKYLDNLCHNNKNYIDILSMGVSCGNQIEDDDIIDLTYNRIIEYNINDILLFFNNGVFHAFSYPEFENLLSKEINPYNRAPMPLTANLITNIKFKKKIKRHLANRYVSFGLEGTLRDNIYGLLYELNKDINFASIDQKNILTTLRRDFMSLLFPSVF